MGKKKDSFREFRRFFYGVFFGVMGSYVAIAILKIAVPIYEGLARMFFVFVVFLSWIVGAAMERVTSEDA